MRSAVLIGTDFAYDSKGKLIPLEINTNVGWDTVNRKESIDEIFDFTDLSMYVRENAIKEILLEGKIAEICKDVIQKAIPHVAVSEATMGDYEEEHPNTTLFVRTAWSSQALVDTFAASKEKFKSLIKSEDFCEGFSEPSGNLPNLVVKAIDPQYNKLEYPKFYKADVSTLRVPHGFIVEPAVLNVDNLVEGRIPIFRNWSLFIAGENGDKIDTIYLGTYTKVCGDEFDESKLKYDSTGALVEGRGMLLSLDGLSTQWPADALVEASDEVLMSDGSWKKASELKVGDSVKSLQFEDSLDIRHHVGQLTTTEKELKKSFAVATVDFLTRTRGYRDFVEIKFSDNSDWFDTANSSYLVKRDSGLEFDYISNLKKGDVVYFLKDGSKLATKVVESVDTVRKYVDTYNVGLAENHIFFSRGEGETSAFASLEHNDTVDCKTDPKSEYGAFQTFISFDGSTAAKNTLNISSDGVVVTSGSVTKTFAKTSGTASANGEYVNPNNYSSGNGGFTGCWYPLGGNNTWNINVPVTTVEDVKNVATIVRIGSADGNALNGANTYWKFTEISSIGSNILWPVTFSSATGPCKLHVQVYQPSDIIQVTEPTGKNFEADGTVISGNTTASISFPQGTGTKGNVSGSIKISDTFLSFDYTGSGVAEEERTVGLRDFNTAKGNVEYSTKAGENGTYKLRTSSVSTTVKTVAGEDLLIRKYTMLQKGVQPTLEVNPESIVLPSKYEDSTYTVSVTSNAPWKVLATSGDGFTVAEQTGTGSGNFVIQAVSASVHYSYSSGDAYGVGIITVQTTADVDRELTNNVESSVQVIRRAEQYVPPVFVSESNWGRDVLLGCTTEYYANNELSMKNIVWYTDEGSGTSEYQDNSASQRVQSNMGSVESPNLTDAIGWTFADCLPLHVKANSNKGSNISITVNSSDLERFGVPFGFIELGSAVSTELYDRILPYAKMEAVEGVLDNTVNIDSDIIPDETFGTQTASKTEDNWCLLIGTGSSEITEQLKIGVTMSYEDLVSGEMVETCREYVYGGRPTIEVSYEGQIWDSLYGAMGNALPSGSSTSTLILGSLQSESVYKLVASPSVQDIRWLGEESVLGVEKTGEEWMLLQDQIETGFGVLVSENKTSMERWPGVALIPKESTTVTLPETQDTCIASGVSCYCWMQACQSETPTVVVKPNSITVECNPREIVYTRYDAAGLSNYPVAYYDITASANSVVSSSVSFTLTPQPEGNFDSLGHTLAGTGSATVTVSGGSSVKKVAPSVFGWTDYNTDAILSSVGSLKVGTLSPKGDSSFEYSVGTVNVHSVPSLGGPKKYVFSGSILTGGEQRIIVASYNLSGLNYTVSSSNSDLTCSLCYPSSTGNTSVRLMTGSRTLIKPGTTCTVTLNRDGKFIASRAVQIGESLTILNAAPSEIGGNLSENTRSVILYTGSNLDNRYGLKADSVTCSDSWITVAESHSSQTGGYTYNVKVASASRSRTGSIVFGVDGTVGITVPVQQTSSKTDNPVRVWFRPGELGSVEMLGGTTTFNFSSASAANFSGKTYEYLFTYTNLSNVPFTPQFTGNTEAISSKVSVYSPEVADISTTPLTGSSGMFYVTVGGVNSSTASEYLLGYLSISSSVAGATLPAKTRINATVR